LSPEDLASETARSSFAILADCASLAVPAVCAGDTWVSRHIKTAKLQIVSNFDIDRSRFLLTRRPHHNSRAAVRFTEIKTVYLND